MPNNPVNYSVQMALSLNPIDNKSKRASKNGINVGTSTPDSLAPPPTVTRLHYVPICLVLFFPCAFLLCYAIALELGHINAFFAFISDAGTLPPEQYVFAQMMNVGAALFAYFIYVRYIQVDQYLKVRYNQRHSFGNVIALAIGFVSSLGMSIVGNFPELHIKDAHYLGAFLAFVGGSVYTIFQGYFTFKLLPHFQTKFVAYLRIFLGVLGLMLYFGAQGSILLAYNRIKNKEKLENSPKALKWSWNDGGYPFRAASVVMEWLLVFIFDAFIITFISEFKAFRMEEPHVRFFHDVTVIPEEDTAAERKSKEEDDDMPDEVSHSSTTTFEGRSRGGGEGRRPAYV